MEYESNVLKRLIDTYGVIGNPRYLSEIIKEFIVRGKELYPQLFTYQSDWLAHIDEFGLTPEYTVSYTGQHIYAPNTKGRPVKRAILKGSTKYRDIDTGEVLDTFEDGRNLELVSVKMPVLTTSNEDGTKTNILTVNEDVTLRGIGDVKDTLDCLTGEVTERIGEVVLNGSEVWEYTNKTFRSIIISDKVFEQVTPSDRRKIYLICDRYKSIEYDTSWDSGEFIALHISKQIVFRDERFANVNDWKQYLSQNPITVQYHLATESIKTVDLTIHDKDHQKVERLTSFEGGTHFTTSSQDVSLLPTLTVDVVTDLEETLVVCSLEGNTM